MTIENLATIENVREYRFDPKEVIKGLNGYYGSDKCNSYITVRRNDVEGPAYLSSPIYLSSLIEWLRVDYDIFYRPGLILDQVEAARSATKICCLRFVIKDEISKRGLWCDKDADIPELVDTVFKAYDECSKARDRNRKDATKLSEVTQELRKELNALKDTVSKVRIRLNKKFIPLPGYEDDLEKLVDIALRGVAARDETINRLTRPWHDECKDIMEYIRYYEASKNGFNLPEEIDDEPLTVKRVFHDLLELLKKRTAEIREVNDKRWEDLRGIYKALGCNGAYSNVDDFAKAVKERAEYIESLSRNAKMETQKAVNEQLKKDTDYIAEVLRDILEALGISKSDTMRFDVFGLKTKALQRASIIKSEHERYREQLGKATADYKALSEENQKLKASQKSDINKLIRDCCTKHGVIAPSRYFSDEACIEYLFSLIEQKDRSFAILQNLYRDIFKKQPDGLSAKDIANNILDKVLETEALLHLESVDNYKLSLKDYILHDIKERGYRYNGLETKSIEEIVDWIIAMATCPNKILEEAKKEAKKEAKQECYWYLWNALKKLSPECDALRIDRYEDLVDRIFYEMSLVMENCKQCQRKHSTEKLGYILRTNKAEEELKKLRSANEANNDVIKKLKELLNEINKEEDGEWFKP